jgi:hypothetical protein
MKNVGYVLRDRAFAKILAFAVPAQRNLRCRLQPKESNENALAHQLLSPLTPCQNHSPWKSISLQLSVAPHRILRPTISSVIAADSVPPVHPAYVSPTRSLPSSPTPQLSSQTPTPKPFVAAATSISPSAPSPASVIP